MDKLSNLDKSDIKSSAHSLQKKPYQNLIDNKRYSISLSQSSQEDYNEYSDHDSSRIDTINDLNQINLNYNKDYKKYDTMATETSPMFNQKL